VGLLVRALVGLLVRVLVRPLIGVLVEVAPRVMTSVVLLVAVVKRLEVLARWVGCVRSFLSEDRAHRDQAGNAGDSHKGS
jgi:hypothetical protein